MARQYLYHVTPTRNVESILRIGLEPRPGEWRTQKWPQRVWLCTGIDASYMLVEIFMFEGRYNCWLSPNSKDRSENHYWKKIGNDGKETGLKSTGDPWSRPLAAGEKWQVVKGDTLSIITLKRAKIAGQIHPNDLADFHYRSTARKRQLATVWTADPIPPDPIVDVREADLDYLLSPAYRRYAGGDLAGNTNRRRADAPSSYVPVFSKKGVFLGIKRNKKLPIEGTRRPRRRIGKL
jgi:hypothetical protein